MIDYKMKDSMMKYEMFCSAYYQINKYWCTLLGIWIILVADINHRRIILYDKTKMKKNPIYTWVYWADLDHVFSYYQTS